VLQHFNERPTVNCGYFNGKTPAFAGVVLAEGEHCNRIRNAGADQDLFLAKITIGCRIKYINRVSN